MQLDIVSTHSYRKPGPHIQFDPTRDSNCNDYLRVLINEALSDDGQELKTSDLPFKICQVMANHFVVPFVNEVYVQLAGNNDIPESPSTSCIHNLYALAAIFFNRDVAKYVIKRLGFCKENIFGTKFSNWGEYPFYYREKYLFSGPMVQLLDKQVQEDDDYCNDEVEAISDTFTHSLTQSFFQYIDPIIADCEKIEGDTVRERIWKVTAVFEKALARLPYDFNRSSWENFRSELKANEDVVTQESSVIYCVAILQPEYVTELPSDWDMPSEEVFYHAFIIEQLFDPESEKVLYRVYQSWKDEYTLAKYLTNGKGTYTAQEFEEFLNDLEIVICSNDFDEETRIETHIRCFGVERLFNSHAWYDQNSCILQGASFRFLSRHINPQDCLNNLVSFIESNPELEKNVRQTLTLDGYNKYTFFQSC